jgi:hypothetical protein
MLGPKETTMTDDTNPFGTFQPQPGPTFEDSKPVNQPATEVEVASPKRRSRRSKATPAAPLRRSSAKAAEPTPRRKYTRRQVAAASPIVAPAIVKPKRFGVTARELQLMRGLSDEEMQVIVNVLSMPQANLSRLAAVLQALSE